MRILLSHISALQCLRASALPPATYGKAALARVQSAFANGSKPTLDTIVPKSCSYPLHTIVPDRSLLVRNARLQSHLWQHGLVPNSVAALSDGTLICSPEFVFLQMANVYSFVDLILLGYELCGTYRNVQNEGFPVRDTPLTSVSQIAAFLESVPGAHGRRKALSALRYVRDNSASPMESILVVSLCLPRVKGGYGIEFPQLNYKINLPTGERATVGHAFYRCDLYFKEARLCLEYNSRLIHESDEHMNEDATRANLLKLLGIEVITVTNRQVFDEAKLRNIARIVLRSQGKRMRPESEKILKRRASLRSQLSRSLR